MDNFKVIGNIDAAKRPPEANIADNAVSVASAVLFLNQHAHDDLGPAAVEVLIAAARGMLILMTDTGDENLMNKLHLAYHYVETEAKERQDALALTLHKRIAGFLDGESPEGCPFEKGVLIL